MNPKQLFLIDGYALAYRAYYALIKTPLTNSKGQPTSAVLGFANYLLKLISEFNCPYIAVVMDSPVPTFRHELYPRYKANRVEMPDDMKSQIPLIHKLIEVFNIVKLQKDRLEADDIIAYLTEKAVSEGFEVSLVTKDKDLMQLIGPKVRMLAPETGGRLDVFGPEEVKNKLGVFPEQVRDLLALMGDASDNIPGIPGIGPKTAQKILEKAGTIDALLENISCIDNPKLQAKIIENKESLLLSEKLVTLNTGIGMDIDLQTLKSKEMHTEECVQFFKELDFHSLLKHPAFAHKKRLEYSAIVPASMDELREIVRKITAAGFVSIDTETTSIVARQAKLVGISLAIDKKEAYYVPVGHDPGVQGPGGPANLFLGEAISVLKDMIESPGIAKFGQNLKYDYQVFKNYGLTLRNIAFDAMIAAYLIDPGTRQYSLDALAQQWLGVATISIESLIGKGKAQKNFAQVPILEAARYSGEDAVIPLYLKELFEPILAQRRQTSLLHDVELPLISVLGEMEWQGIKIDAELLKKLSEDYTKRLTSLSQEIYKLAGEEFNLNSPKQISEVLFKKLALPKSKKTKTGLSTDVDALEKLAGLHPVVPNLLEYREVQKLLSTYIDAFPALILPESQRLHSSFNQTITATGRLSSTTPNLQNIPIRTDAGRKIREAFIAPIHYLIIAADYSQIELRMLAHVSKDKFLVQAFLDDKDIHTQTASAIYNVFPEMVTPEMRRSAKTINFGLIYGMGPINLSRQLNISFTDAQAFIDAYFRQFPSIESYMKGSIERARGLGYSETILGRRRYLPEITSENRQVREAAERTALNTPIQGSAADIIKMAMVRIQEALPGKFPNAKMLLQVHDELVFEAPKTEAEDLRAMVVGMMSGAYKLDVPLKVDAGIGENWSEAH
jgi:DNA polymerase-1